jgi:hypothetical protein
MKTIHKNKLSALKYVLIAVISFGSFNSCTDENVIALEPFNQLSESAAFTTPALIQLSVTGMYNAAQRGAFGGGRGYPFGAAFVQQGDNRGEDVVNIATFYQFTYTGTYDPTSANNSFYWSDTYRLINRANIVLEGVEGAVANGIITQQVANVYIGEAKFLRAIAHQELMWHFAKPFNDTPGATHFGVPYRDFAINTTEAIDLALVSGRNTVAECYARIIDDLNDAEALLSTKAQRGSVILGIVRATKESAIAFKTRAYLHMRNWPMVITEGVKLNGIYSLAASPDGVFGAAGYNNTESIFSIENTALNFPTVNGALASQYKQRLLVSMSPIIWRNPAWLLDDRRREEGGLIRTVGGVKYTNKYKDNVTYTDPAPVIRYAEVLLNMAEAYARIPGSEGLALTTLNTVRNRSLAAPATQAYVTANFLTPASLVQAIITERRIEFAMEGRRWPDIHRLQNDNLAPIVGIPEKVANGRAPAAAFNLGTPYTGPFGVEAYAYSDKEFLWPIPQVEVNNNPILAGQQNPGW